MKASEGSDERKSSPDARSDRKGKEELTSRRGSHRRRHSAHVAGVRDGLASGMSTRREDVPTNVPRYNPHAVKIPKGFVWMPVPQGTQITGSIQAGGQAPWDALDSVLGSGRSGSRNVEDDPIENDPPNLDSSLKPESLDRRARQQKKKMTDAEARQREQEGLKPYVVRVKPGGND